MINKLVVENLKDHWVRTLLSAIVVGVQVMSILTLIGLSRGMLQDSAERAKGTGADIFLKPDTQGTFSFSSGQMNPKFVPFIAKQPHVVQAVGVLSIPVELVTQINGVDIPQFEKISGGFRFIQGGLPQGPDDLIIDEYYARQNKLHAGQTWKLLNHDWRVSGIVEGGVLGRLIVPLTTLQALTGNANPPRITEILVKLDNPALTRQEVNRFNDQLKGNLRAISVEDFVSQFSVNKLPQLRAFIDVIIVIAVVVGFLVVFLSMYTAVVERTREIGILKALGAKPRKILDILVREAVLLAVAGCLIGIVLSFGTKALITTLMPASLRVVNTPDWWPIAAAIALGGALLGAIYPGLKAARQDTIEALAYE
ncbi:MAG: FtsX-like permease family protein [Acidobacteriaceae bacterium]|nr:FtsX-like permease family protein [Acidobacteriaceae bacterium]MBV9767261.1 FtsX-like permease family protein [Acidobacteriaceae bacterium]